MALREISCHRRILRQVWHLRPSPLTRVVCYTLRTCNNLLDVFQTSWASTRTDTRAWPTRWTPHSPNWLDINFILYLFHRQFTITHTHTTTHTYTNTLFMLLFIFLHLTDITTSNNSFRLCSAAYYSHSELMKRTREDLSVLRFKYRGETF